VLVKKNIDHSVKKIYSGTAGIASNKGARMNYSKASFITLASILATACGTESNDTKTDKTNAEQVKIQLENLKIKTEAVSKVGFTEVETGE
jgi:hypothetical protein